MMLHVSCNCAFGNANISSSDFEMQILLLEHCWWWVVQRWADSKGVDLGQTWQHYLVWVSLLVCSMCGNPWSVSSLIISAYNFRLLQYACYQDGNTFSGGTSCAAKWSVYSSPHTPAKPFHVQDNHLTKKDVGFITQLPAHQSQMTRCWSQLLLPGQRYCGYLVEHSIPR